MSKHDTPPDNGPQTLETMQMPAFHQFDNGVKVYDYHLTPRQRKRYKHINIHEPVEEELFANIISSLAANECFVSVGSAIGYYPILAKLVNPNIPVYAFDPLEIHMERFQENIILNGFRPDDFFIHKKAISSQDGHSTFLEQTFGSVVIDSFFLFKLNTYLKIFIKKLLTITKIRNFQVGYSTVETLSLNSLKKTIQHPVGLLQMDIQGVEAAVLNGGTGALQSQYIHNFLIGTHGTKIHEQCIEILRQFNYLIQFEKNEVDNQPDGIIFASAP